MPPVLARVGLFSKEAETTGGLLDCSCDAPVILGCLQFLVGLPLFIPAASC